MRLSRRSVSSFLLGGAVAVANGSRTAFSTGTDTSAASVPAKLYLDLAYGPHPEQRLDLWRPVSGNKPFSLCVYFHGGGFGKGGKDRLPKPFRNDLLSRGVAVASVSYRLGENARFPNPMMDGARSIQFLRYKAEELQLDPLRIAASGRSAGGALALWLAYHEDLRVSGSASELLRQSSRVKTVATINAQTTFRSEDIKRIFNKSNPPPFFKNLLGANPSPETEAEASPLFHYSAEDPPTLLIYIERGKRTPQKMGPGGVAHDRRFADPLISQSGSKGTDVQVRVIPASEAGSAYILMAEFLQNNLG